MAEVRRIGLASTAVNGSAVGIVEETLARVRSGEVTSVAIVEVRRGGEVAFRVSETDQYHALNSGCARLAVRLAADPGEDG